MRKAYKADLHVHTCLSPCAELDMRPSAMVRRAREQGLDAMAICDHNSAENVGAVKAAGKREGLMVIGGMEITSSEEVHILGLFGDDAGLAKMQALVYEALPGQNDVDFFGDQLVANDRDELVASNERLLIGATTLSVHAVVQAVHDLGGLAIASHIDREAFSLVGQLGFVPPNLPLDALEVSPRHDPDRMSQYRDYGFPLVTSSDAHCLPDIGKRCTVFQLDEMSFSELTMALAGSEGRHVEI